MRAPADHDIENRDSPSLSGGRSRCCSRTTRRVPAKAHSVAIRNQMATIVGRSVGRKRVENRRSILLLVAFDVDLSPLAVVVALSFYILSVVSLLAVYCCAMRL